MNRLSVLGAASFSSALACVVAFAVGCSEDPVGPAVAPAVDDGGAEGRDATAPIDRPHDASAEADAGDQDLSTCARTKAWAKACGTEDSLNCGDSFDRWCSASDEAINSEAYREGVRRCFDAEHCETAQRTACVYGTYATATQTEAQKALVAAYCASCEPEDTAGCATRATTYDTKAGPAAVPDVFIAAWELRDSLTDEIRASCTGSALDAGAPDAGADGGVNCAKSFANCAGDIYLGHIPDCP